jgi:predicted acyl esterase
MPPRVCEAGLEAGLEVPLADGVITTADHYGPLLTGPAPTILVRSPYGRGFPWGNLYGATLARQGFHVVISSCRGTGGSQGTWTPFRGEGADGADVVAWLRSRPWFDGRLATVGSSYLGHTQLALAAGQVPEWRAAVVMAPAASPGHAYSVGGVLGLESVLVAGLARLQGQVGFPTFLRAAGKLARKTKRIGREMPLIESYRLGFDGPDDVLEGFLTHPDPDDPFWAGTDQRAHAPGLPPTLLVGGWWDLLQPQTLDVHARRTAAGLPTRLLIGPWTHTSMVEAGWPEVLAVALPFLRAELGVPPRPDPATARPGLAAAPPGPPDGGVLPVRVHVGGDGGGWRDLPTWPPAGVSDRSWTLGPGCSLTPDSALTPNGSPTPDGHASRPGKPSVIRYDPADPTPSRGGATLARPGGVVDNARIERRPDVLLFTSAPLREAVEVLGTPRARLRLKVTGESADVFVRLCDVDSSGVSRNVCDGILRLHADTGVFGPDGGGVAVALGATAHRFAAGHRIRVQVSGGAHPYFARNTGTGEPVATRLAPATIEVLHPGDDPAVLDLPLSGAESSCARRPMRPL